MRHDEDMTSTLTFTTTLSTPDLEALEDHILPVRITRAVPDDHYAAGQDAIVKSTDGGVFIAHIEDVEPERSMIYIELD